MVLKFIVISNFGIEIVKYYGVEMIEVLIGFKFIVE